ncbi:MAG TPA: BON domain-containing protein [Salinarimonas sp.]|jgi:hypothetical protein|nr:BON domain-containing protein [Salinarimonas sp.]
MPNRDRNRSYDRDQSRYGGHQPDDDGRSREGEGRDRYLGDSSGGYGTGGAAIDYHDVMGGGYGARDYGQAYPDLDPAHVFDRIDRGDVPSRRGLGPKGYQRSDERVLEDVHERLTEDPHLDASDIEVSVQDGEVRLSGFVGNRTERRYAEDLVEGISGVRHVQNDLRLRERDEGARGAVAGRDGTQMVSSGTGAGAGDVTSAGVTSGRRR